MQARRGEWLGSIIVAAPLSRWVLTLLVVALATAILLFPVFGHYTRRETVVGQLVSSAGLLNVVAPSAGTVSKLHVHDGHLMRLPLDWFEKRHIGDVVSRFGSIQTIQQTLTAQFIGSLLDGLMSLVTLVVMGFYSLTLTALVVGLFLAYGLLRWAFFNPLRRANEEQIVYGTRQESELLESIRGAMPIKLANKQDERLPEASIELCHVSSRYAENEPWILHDCNLKVEAGESVAITGPSGCGKSTLAKIVLGLLEPTEGVVKFGGIDIRKLGLDTYRQWVGAVMQDDQLFAGSIADNIGFFHAEPDMARIVAVAQMAAIHEDIMAMPMGYQSLVGDMGSSLSGGQRQRVILARALYRRPKLLVLDEATSHLDSMREKMIGAAVRRLKFTRIVIAHRSEAVTHSDRIFDARDESLVFISRLH